MSDQEVFRDWGKSSRADVVRRRVLFGILAIGAVLAILAVKDLEYWNRSHAGVLKAEQERMPDAQIGVGMCEIEVRAKLGEPAEVEEAPFDPRGPNGGLQGPSRACKRLIYRFESETTIVYLDAADRVLDVDHGLRFDPVELWSRGPIESPRRAGLRGWPRPGLRRGLA